MVRGRMVLSLTVCTVLAAGCADRGGDVSVGRSNTHGGLDPDIVESSSSTPTSEPTPASSSTAESTMSTIVGADDPGWQACDDEDAPWECGSISVPLDYSDPSGDQITIALNRLPASQPDRRIGSLVLNPGGPGGSGVNLAYNLAYAMPQEVLDQFDIVGFDPRGVGASTSVECPGGIEPATAPLRQCIRDGGSFLSFLGTPNVARDLDRVRAAIGDDKITYVGYSYGTALGGVYADMFPDHIRALVLDGSVDPTAGRVNTTKDFGDDFYAVQDFAGTIDLFLQLCDATSACRFGPNAEHDLSTVEDTIGALPTPYADGVESLDFNGLESILFSSMYTVRYWPMLAVALDDAANGDASTLVALDSYMQFGYPAKMEAEPNFHFANLAIQCADFAGRGPNSPYCSDFPVSAEPIPEITTAEGAPAVVVIGTRGDPATPWHYSGEMAEALGNAVSITWEGAGHTAFLSSRCIDDLVVRYLIDLTVPAADADCPFVVGATTTAEDADAVFTTLGTASQMAQLDATLEDLGATPEFARCVGEGILARGDARLIVHELLGVDSPDLAVLRSIVEQACTDGG